jgi:hypothetical protein
MGNSLMWFIYAVENLTYGGSAFAILAVLGAIFYGSAKLHNAFGVKQSRSITNPPGIEEGHTYILATGWYGFQAGETLLVRKLWRSLNEVRVNDSHKDYNLSSLQDAVAKDTVHIQGDTPLNFPFKTAMTVILLFGFLHVVMPSRQTAIYMAGGYVAQEIITSEQAGEMGGLAMAGAKAQLVSWAREVPELQTLVKGAVGDIDFEVQGTAESIKEGLKEVAETVKEASAIIKDTVEEVQGTVGEVKGES